MPLFPFNPNLGQTIQGQTPSTPVLKMGYLAHYSKAPAAIAAASVLASTSLLVGAQPGYTTGIVQPDVPRCLSVVGGQAGETGVCTIYGTDVSGAAISEALTLNGTTTVNGAKAFKTVTSADLPARNAGGDTISIGVTNKLGMYHKLGNALLALVKLFNAATDAGTMVSDPTNLYANQYTPAGTLDGVKKMDIWYIVGA